MSEGCRKTSWNSLIQYHLCLNVIWTLVESDGEKKPPMSNWTAEETSPIPVAISALASNSAAAGFSQSEAIAYTISPAASASNSGTSFSSSKTEAYNNLQLTSGTNFSSSKTRAYNNLQLTSGTNFSSSKTEAYNNLQLTSGTNFSSSKTGAYNNLQLVTGLKAVEAEKASDQHSILPIFLIAVAVLAALVVITGGLICYIIEKNQRGPQQDSGEREKLIDQKSAKKLNEPKKEGSTLTIKKPTTVPNDLQGKNLATGGSAVPLQRIQPTPAGSAVPPQTIRSTPDGPSKTI